MGREYPQVGGNYTVLHHTQLLNRLIRDKRLVPVVAVGSNGQSADITYHDPCYLGRHNKVYEAPRELIGASGAKLTEMPRHADRGLCCGAGGARMWMEEHIGKRVNHERVEEALDTGASKIATACPFCRVMMTDGVDDVAAATDVPKAEVLDVAQLLLGSLDKSSVTLPEKGTAAKAAAAKAETDVKVDTAPAAPAEPKKEPKATAAPAAEKAPAAPPVKGLGIAGGAKRPGAKKTAAPQPEPEPPAEPAKPEPEAKGLGIAAGARRPGAKKAPTAPKPAAPQPEPASDSESDAAAEPSAEGNGETPAPPVKGLGIARGARPPGKR
jgi:hypothetical protein